MSTTETVASTIKAHILAEFLPGTPSEELDNSYDLIDNGVVDSLGLLRLISWVEQRFHVPLDEVELSPDDFRSIDAIGHFVEASTRS
ncbi:acyl carrier protein [Pseudonocardiaceae bacterium YIM PH 21723]|nr:acyl carrier protein [Pseudonocardiaceae bacterium YIM PH 21723]